jgi:hypothetical protein
MATDRNLIAGAARLADADSAKSLGFGAGLAQSALRIQKDIAERTNERRGILRQDMNTAATFIGKMQTLDKVTGQYHDVLTERGIYTRDELNRIATDTTLNSAQKIAEYSKLTNEYNALASQFTNDQQKLIGLQNSVAQGLTSETLDFNDEDTAIARGLGKGGYEITKDGYNVTYDVGVGKNSKSKTILVKSQDLDKYIGKYSIKNIEGLTKIKNNFITETANAKGDTEAERLVQEKYRQLLTTDQKLKMLVDLEGNSVDFYKNDEAVISAFDDYAKKLTEDFGYNLKPEERKDLFNQDLEIQSKKMVANLMNDDFKDFKNVKSLNGYKINEIVVESALGLANLKSRGYDVDGYEDQIGRVRIMTIINGEERIDYYNNNDNLIKDLLREKLLTTAEGQEERKQARDQSLKAFSSYKEQQVENYNDTIEKIKTVLENNENDFNKLNDEQKKVVKFLPGEFPDVEIPDPTDTGEEATNTKLDKVEIERKRINWKTSFVNNGEFDKYLKNNNISKEGAINKSTGMVKSTIVNRPDFKEAFGSEYPANTYREGSVLLGKMQSEFYGKDFLRTPRGGFTKETRTEYEQRVQARDEDYSVQADKKDRTKYFRASAEDLSAYDQLAKNDENIPKLSQKDFKSFIDTGELDNKYVNVILNNEDKFSSTLVDLITKEF